MRLPAAFFRLAGGKEPGREWLLALSAQDRKIVGDDIRDLEFAWPIGLPLCRSLGGGLWEVRSNLTDGKIGRVVFCVENERAVLLHDFVKKTQPPPQERPRSGRETEKGAGLMTEGKGGIGSSFESFLEEEGRLEESTTTPIKRVLARQIARAMEEQKISKTEMARRMRTSRAQLDRFLDPANESVTLQTMQNAAKAVGRSLRLELA